jgi:hypothetical protein
VAQREIHFDAQSALRLLTHYTDGDLPLDSELAFAGVSPRLQRWLCFGIASREWTQEELAKPLHVRYEGRKVMSWSKNSSDPQPVWEEGVEAPKRQG